MKKLNIFLAHPANMSPKEIDSLVEPVRDALASHYNEPGGISFKIITGRADYKRFFAQSGGWVGWQKSVVERKDAVTGDRMYSGFVTVGETCGHATAAILKGAMEAGLEVLHWKPPTEAADHPEDCIRLVDRIETEDETNWQTGYKIHCVELWDSHGA